MATKVISTHYTIDMRVTTGGVDMGALNRFIFKTKVEMKQFLAKALSGSTTGTGIAFHLYQDDCVWNDSTHFITANRTELTTEDL